MYNLEWREFISQTGATLTDIDSPPYELTELTPNLEYEFRVQEVINGVVSPFSPWLKFRTTSESTVFVVGSTAKVPSRARQFRVGIL